MYSEMDCMFNFMGRHADCKVTSKTHELRVKLRWDFKLLDIKWNIIVILCNMQNKTNKNYQ